MNNPKKNYETISKTQETHFEFTSVSGKLAELQLCRPESARVTGLYEVLYDRLYV